MQKIKCGDTVVVLAGKDKGRQGSVLKIVSNPLALGTKKEISKVVVEGVNMVKKHVKANPSQEQAGGIIEKEAPLPISNVALFNPTTKKADRVGIKVLESGQKVRIYKSSGEVVDV